MDFTTAFKIAGLAEKIGTKIHASLKSAKGNKRKVLIELQENIDVIYLWRNKDFPIDKVIKKLKRNQYESALAENFEFNSIMASTLSKSTTRGVPQFSKYIGWSTEKLFDSLYGKIKLLKDIVDMDANNKKISKEARLTNIYKLMILLVHHIKK